MASKHVMPYKMTFICALNMSLEIIETKIVLTVYFKVMTAIIYHHLLFKM
jgi:hypothetical protein